MRSRSLFLFLIIFTTSFIVFSTVKKEGGSLAKPVSAVENIISETIENITETKRENLGLLMFRGNETRTFYGTGQTSKEPKIIWKYPEKPMCSNSTVAGITKEWCGTGWTGQPVVWERKDGIIEVIFGAYDKKIHFLDAKTGKDVREPFETGDIIKGSVTLDPDGFPLIYFGSRDNKLRIVALDRESPEELWNLEAKVSDGLWNNDWDGNPLISDGILYEGSENGIFHAVELNRNFDENGKAVVSPVEIFKTKSYDDKLLENIGDKIVSIENSVAKFKDRVYFANSGGRIIGLDVKNIKEGSAPVVFDFWTGDDIDASIVIDDEGMLYVGIEEERLNTRSKEVGQIIKLNPYKENALVWSVFAPKINTTTGGVWATPGMDEKNIYVPTNTGNLLVIDKEKGTILGKEFIGEHAWSSPSIIDKNIILGTCNSGGIRSYSIENPTDLKLNWKIENPPFSCVESTPAIWNGQIFFGSRDGYFYSIK